MKMMTTLGAQEIKEPWHCYWSDDFTLRDFLGFF